MYFLFFKVEYEEQEEVFNESEIEPVIEEVEEEPSSGKRFSM